jgi:hypothetical protein
MRRRAGGDRGGDDVPDVRVPAHMAAFMPKADHQRTWTPYIVFGALVTLLLMRIFYTFELKEGGDRPW